MPAARAARVELAKKKKARTAEHESAKQLFLEVCGWVVPSPLHLL